MKKLLAGQFETLYYFFTHLRYKIFIALAFSLLVGVLDGLGLSMFLPLLQLVGSQKVDPVGMGNLSFLIGIVEKAGISLTLFSVLMTMLLFFLVKGIVVYISIAYRVNLQQYFVTKVRIQLLHGLDSMNYKSFVTSDAGRIQNTMSGEVERVAQGYSLYIESIQQGIMVLVYTGFAFFIDYRFAILVSVGGASTNLVVGYLHKRTKNASQKFTRDSNTYQGLIIQHVGNYKYLKATGVVHDFEKRLKGAIEKIEFSRRQMGLVNALMTALREPMLVTIVVLVILVQVNALGGELGGILISLLFFYRALTAVNQMQGSWNRFVSNTGSLENTKELQKILDEAHEDTPHKKQVHRFGDIELKDAEFFYGETRVLSGINLKIGNKESVAFVGESGSGKTTIVNILTGLMPLDRGDFFINGERSLDVDLNEFRKRVGYITQDPVIFNDSIFNNVTLWADSTQQNQEKFKNAIKNASILEFVEGLPNGENTQLGNNGINLSGGQKQRISIARELFKEIDILIMDEATSSLDSQTERTIQENIEALKGQYTLVIIAHRLSTVRNVDKVVLMEKGSIKGSGNFNDLANRFPQFKKMLELQEVSSI